MPSRLGSCLAITATLIACMPLASAQQDATATIRTGSAAYGDWHDDVPGRARRLTPADMPPPHATSSASRGSRITPRPPGVLPQVPPGFSASLFASGFDTPRTLRTAPNGDVFLAESGAGRIRVLRPAGAGHAAQAMTFADQLREPFGIAFWPPGPHPRFVYIADTDRVLRYQYAAGDLHATAPAQTIIRDLPEGGHWTRDLAFSPDGRTLYVSVGSASNDAADLPALSATGVAAMQARDGLGAAWGEESGRAAVLAFDPDGTPRGHLANGLRNCVALAVQPASVVSPAAGRLWCATNERDGLGDDLPPDYVTAVQAGGFYGWPWYYIGDHQDPRHAGQRPDLSGHVDLPDVLIQPHSAPLGLVFYPATGSFPAEYRGDAFVALHGSWNRAMRTGYKIVRVRLHDGQATGEYDDFLTGLVNADGSVWARPVGLTVAADGALLMSEDAGGTIWRIAPASMAKP